MGRTHTVRWGDTLSQIALDYLGDADKYHQLAAINNIPNPNLIYVGQVIAIDANPDPTPPASSQSASSKAKIMQFGLLSSSGHHDELFATWRWDRSHTRSYSVRWDYMVNDMWFIGSSSDVSVDPTDPEISKKSVYTFPADAEAVRFKVKPISETYSQNGSNTDYWNARWSDTSNTIFYAKNVPPAAPSVPSVEIKQYQLTVTTDNIPEDVTSVKFQIVKNNKDTYATKKVRASTRHASCTFTVDAGAEYKARCQYAKGSAWSEWSEYSSNDRTVPEAVTSIKVIRAASKTSVYLEWGAAKAAESYDIEFSTKKECFDTPEGTQIITGITLTHHEKTGLDSGNKYFFRVRATNPKGSSPWSSISEVVVGSKPAAPTTWSSTTTAIIGEPLTLYWVHNAGDGSSEKFATVELTINGVRQEIVVDHPAGEENKDKPGMYRINTETYPEGVKVLWRVKTAGITEEFGDWSVQRTVDIYAPPTMELKVLDHRKMSSDTIDTFPFYISALTGPKTQHPTGFDVTIISNSTYEAYDQVGNRIVVNKGDTIFSKYYAASKSLELELSAYDIDLENNVTYTIKCTASMNSGLTANGTAFFEVRWSDSDFIPNAEVAIDIAAYTAQIKPYCEKNLIGSYLVAKTGNSYIKQSEMIDEVFGNVIPNVKTTTGELVYDGWNRKGEKILYCKSQNNVLLDSIFLSVYRREFDGSFTEIAKGLKNTKTTFIVDPHPALDYARYRIVAVDSKTGAVGFYDMPSIPVNGKAVILQWAEQWTEFDVKPDEVLENPPWTGSCLKLPYNIDVSDDESPDVSLVEYVGRSHPVSYYGTQVGHSSSWNVEIEADDKDTLYALRRLSRWMGDVYVREPSGSGYWANVAVSFSQKHCTLTIPVTLKITRVEGGI